MAAKNDRDLFDRLRGAGLRKQMARRLSAVGEDAGRKAVGAARAAVSELRTVADEIERRLPLERRSRSGRAADPGRSEPDDAERTRSESSGGARKRRESSGDGRGGSGSRAGGRARRAAGVAAPRPRAAGARAQAPAAGRKPSAPPGPARAPRGKAPAPRGHNKALILQALADGPKTAAEVARQTGIATGTTSTTLNKLARSGEVVKAVRGYALPSTDRPSAADGASPPAPSFEDGSPAERPSGGA